jgi:site-specific DNA-methyltransferase (adenine-specific)
MGKNWDHGVPGIPFWKEVFRVLKPGGHLLAFGGSRTYHRLACAIEDAGFEIRDQIMWLYGSGFPKSLDVSKAIDKAAGAKRERIGTKVELGIRHNPGRENETSPDYARPWRDDPNADGHWVTRPATEAARKWAGFGTALKPAHEPIVLARKPLIGTVAQNVLAHGTGALNIDGCRVATDEQLHGSGNKPLSYGGENHRPYHDREPRGATQQHALGRWPANVLTDGSEEVVAGFPESISSGGDGYKNSMFCGGKPTGGHGLGDTGSAARFFYTAKADKAERLGSKHPTVKPVDLMAYLCRLICPPGGTVLDPFAGSGSTGMACMREGFDAVLIEREAEYVADIERRIAHVSGGDAPLFAAV